MRGRALPRFPIESLRGEIEGRRIFPGAVGIVAAEGALDHHQIADGALRDELFGLGAQDRADALRTDLNDAPGGFAGFDHFEAIGGRVGHRFFAIDVLAGADGVDDYLLVPVVGNGSDYAINFFVARRDGKIGIADDFARERVTAIVEIGGGYALDPGKLHGVGEQAGALHADADDAEADAVAGRDGGVAG